MCINVSIFKARVEYEVTDASVKTYSFPFPYLRKEFIKVSILHTDNSITALTYGVDYSVDGLTITLVTSPSVSEHLIIYRETTTDKIITWNDGSILLAKDMNTEDAQMLHLQEEQKDYLLANALATSVTGNKEIIWSAQNHRVIDVSDPKEPQDAVTKHYMESVQDGFVSRNTSLLEQATTQATNAKNSASSSATSASQSASSASASETSNQSAKKWAESTASPDNQADTDSTTGKTQSSRSWALFSKSKAQEAAMSATNAKTQAETATTQATNAKTSASQSASSASASATSASNAKTSETNAKTSETQAGTYAGNSKTSADAAKSSETNAKTSETNAATSAKQAAESAGVFQDFKGATASTDGNGGKVPKPLAGQQNKVLKADGTWGDSITPQSLWKCLHSYPMNYVPSDTSNVGWGKLGFCIIYYTEKKINNQPTQYGQLINIPADEKNESMQLWIVQLKGTILSRGGNTNTKINDQPFIHVGIDVDTGRLVFPNGAELWVS